MRLQHPISMGIDSWAVDVEPTYGPAGDLGWRICVAVTGLASTRAPRQRGSWVRVGARIRELTWALKVSLAVDTTIVLALSGFERYTTPVPLAKRRESIVSVPSGCGGMDDRAWARGGTQYISHQSTVGWLLGGGAGSGWDKVIALPRMSTYESVPGP